MQRPLIVLTVALLCSSCISSHKSYRANPKKFVLHESVSEQGESVTYALVAGSDGVPSVTLHKRHKFDVAMLGLRARSLNRELAESLPVRVDPSGEGQSAPGSLAPWTGLFVHRIEGGSPADLAGIQVGDILLSLDGTALSTQEQLRELLQGDLEPGTVVSLTLLEIGADQSYGAQPSRLSLTLGTKQVEVTKSDTLEVNSDVGVYHRTGLQVCTLATDLTLEIYGTTEPVTMVADALVGSPAYLAGLRSGDRVLTCEGKPVRSHVDISRAVLARSRRSQVPADWFGPAAHEGNDEGSGKIAITVDGPFGTHEASLALIGDIDDSSHTYIPILLDYDSTVTSTSWSFLDFIFQFGANYSSHYRVSDSRAPQSSSSLSMFPFGMFEFKSTAQADRCTFFWFIKFEDRH